MEFLGVTTAHLEFVGSVTALLGERLRKREAKETDAMFQKQREECMYSYCTYLTHIAGCRVPEPVVRNDRARPEVCPVIVRPFDRKVPVREGDGRVNRLQRLLKHERQGYMRRHEPGTGMPVVTVPRSSCGEQRVWARPQAVSVTRAERSTSRQGGGQSLLLGATRVGANSHQERWTGNGGGGI